MSTRTASGLVQCQIDGFNAQDLDAATSIYAPDATLVIVSPHTLPGSELRLEGFERITKHLGRAIAGGLRDVVLDWVGEGDGFVAWRDSGVFGTDTAFSESHLARLNDDGLVVEHWIHSIYAR